MIFERTGCGILINLNKDYLGIPAICILVVIMGLPELLYLSRRDVEDVGLTMKEIIDAVEDVFREKGLGRVEMPPKPGIILRGMPSYTPCQHTFQD